MKDKPLGRSSSRHDQSGSERDNHPVLTPEKVQAILNQDAQQLDATAHEIAEQCKMLPRTQMRNFYGPIVRLRNELAGDPKADLARRHARDLTMHRARLVYMAARNGAARPLEKSFAELVGEAICDNRAEKEKVAAICDFAEAVVAYHYPLAK